MPASNLKRLHQRLASLEAERDRIRTEGDVLMGYWIDSCRPQCGKQYKRLRHWRDGKPVVARSLKPEEIAAVQAAIARGRQLKRVLRQISQTVAQIDAIASGQMPQKTPPPGRRRGRRPAAPLVVDH